MGTAHDTTDGAHGSAPPALAAAPARSPRRRWFRSVAVGLAVAALLAVALERRVAFAAAGRLVTAASAPVCDLLIVPGARITADGLPTDLLRERLEAARSLWATGRAPRILLSGRGGGGIAVDEVAAMRRYLEARSVPAAALVDDPLGLRTLDTMDRAHAVFGARSAIVVSQDFHVPRAVFLGRGFGLDVVGHAAPSLRAVRRHSGVRNGLREAAARVVAWLDVHVFGTRGRGCGGS